MKVSHIFAWFFIALSGLIIAAAPVLAQDDRANLTNQNLNNVTISLAVFINDPAGFIEPRAPGMFGISPGSKTMAQFCHEQGFIEPFKSAHTGFEVRAGGTTCTLVWAILPLRGR
jgi:hypothetical protein